MQRFIVFLFVLYTFHFLFSCKKSEDKCPTIYQSGGSMGISIKSTESFEYNLWYHEHKTEVSIIQQPKHYEISEVENDVVNQEFIYKYKPASNYTGLDSVAFQSRDCATKTRVYTKFYISITN